VSEIDPDTPVGRIDVWLTAWKQYFGTLGLPFGANLIAGPPPSAEPRVSADDFGVALEVLATVLADRARSVAAEQQPAEATGGEQVQDGAAGRMEAWVNRIAAHTSDETDTRRIADFRAVLAERNRYRIAWRHARTRARSAGFGADLYAKRARELQAAVHDLIDTQIALVLQLKEQSPSSEPELNVVLAERDALAARVAELEGEREADTRAVARCQQAKAGPDAVPAMLALDARFADRIEALAEDETDGGAA